MQAFAPWGGGSVSEAVPAHVPMFGVNTTGYAPAVIDAGRPNRYEVGGFSDKLFTMVGLIGAGGGMTAWPWEEDRATAA